MTSVSIQCSICTNQQSLQKATSCVTTPYLLIYLFLLVTSGFCDGWSDLYTGLTQISGSNSSSRSDCYFSGRCYWEYKLTLFYNLSSCERVNCKGTAQKRSTTRRHFYFLGNPPKCVCFMTWSDRTLLEKFFRVCQVSANTMVLLYSARKRAEFKMAAN